MVAAEKDLKKYAQDPVEKWKESIGCNDKKTLKAEKTGLT